MSNHIRGVDPFDSPYDNHDTIGSDVAIGSIDVANIEQAGKYAEEAGEHGESVAKKNRGYQKGAKVASDIRKVTRSPYTRAAIAATATVAPPAGAAVAGVATAGLAVAEGVAALAAPVGSLFSRKKKNKKKPRPVSSYSIAELKKGIASSKVLVSRGPHMLRKVAEQRVKKLEGELERRESNPAARLAELQKSLAAAMKMAKINHPMMRTVAEAKVKSIEAEIAELEASPRRAKRQSGGKSSFASIVAAAKKAAAKSKVSAKDKAKASEVVRERSKAASRHKKAVRMLATIMNRAKAGDAQAQDELIALKTLQDPDMMKAKNYAKARMEGFDSKEAKSLASRESALTDKQWKIIVRRARSLAASEPLPKVKRKSKRKAPNKAKIDAVVREGAKRLVGEADRASHARGPIQGLLVEMKRGKIRRGRFKNQLDKGIDGAVVLKNGRVILGDWKGV